METLHQKPTDSTPEIKFDIENSNFIISGMSKPEDVRKFYYPVIEWLEKFKKEYVVPSKSKLHKSGLKLDIKLTYFNSSSAKFLFDILDSIGEFQKYNVQVKVYWYFDENDEDHKEAGEELSEMCELPFNYIAIRD